VQAPARFFSSRQLRQPIMGERLESPHWVPVYLQSTAARINDRWLRLGMTDRCMVGGGGCVVVAGLRQCHAHTCSETRIFVSPLH
jgi:hypothetical protein